jgi:hypothetical protein
MIDLSKVKKGLLDLIAPIIELAVRQAVLLLLNEFAKRNPEDARLTAFELYPIADTKLEPIAEKTATKLDDAGVHGMMRGMEDYAKNNNFTLPNLDDD